jgi:ferrous iron transport protein A
MLINETYIIIGFKEIDRKQRKRLLVMGLLPNTTFKIIRYAPMGDPVEILIRGYSLSIRKSELERLIIEKYND